MSRTDQGSRSNSRVENQLCRNNCSFYGNVIWDGYCSKCYREVYQKSQKVQEKNDEPNNRSVSDGNSSISSQSSPSFFNFHDKRRSHLILKNPLRQLVNRSSFRSVNSAIMTNGEQTIENQSSTEFLDKIKNEEVKNDVRSQVKTFSNHFQKKVSSKTVDLEVLRDEFVSFRESMKKRIQTNPIYRDENEDLFLQVRDYLEKIIFSKHYANIFQLITLTFEEKDLWLQRRINSLQWVTPAMLDTVLNESLPNVIESMEKAMRALMEMDSKRTPQEKVESIIDCKNFIEESIRSSSSVGINADIFLPTLIYIVLKARPPRLRSNIEFLTMFSQPTGEQLYYFANLDSAVRFIELIEASHLGLSSDEFLRRMRGQPIEMSQFGLVIESVTPSQTTNQQMRKNFILFHELDQQCEKFDESLIEFNRRLNQSASDIEQMLNDSFRRFPPMKKLPQLIDIETIDSTNQEPTAASQLVDVFDQSTPENDKLPEPLAPEKFQQPNLTEN